MDEKKTIYLETGLASKNTIAFRNVTEMARELGKDFCDALAGIHSTTGCDQIECFAGKGKLKALKLLKNNKSYQKAFATLGSSEIVSDETEKQIEIFVCELYGILKHTDPKRDPEVNDARFQLFCSKYEPKKKTRSILQVKGMDGSSLPPCQSALHQHILRTNCLCSVWNFAHSFESKMFNPEDNGWNLISDQNGNCSYVINWFEGNMMPKKLEEIMEPDQPEPSSLRRSTISAGDESEQEEDESDGENDLDNDSEEEEGQNEVIEDD